MEVNKKQVNEKMSIDLGRALQALLKNGLMISLVAVLCAVHNRGAREEEVV